MKKYGIFDTDKFSRLLKTDKTFSTIIEWVEHNPQEFLSKSQEQICKLLFLSQATISRFVKKIGFNTFKELQIFVARKLQELNPEFNIVLKENKGIDNIKYNVFQQYSNLSKIVFNSIDEEVLESISADIVEAEHIFLIGIGTNGLMSEYYSSQFRKFGISASKINTFHQFVDEIEGFNSKLTHFIVISKSLGTREIRMIIQILSKNKKNFTVITTNSDYKFFYCKNLLIYDYFYDKSFSFDIANKIAICMIMDILYFRVISNIDPNLINFQQSKELVKKWNM